MAGRHEYSTVPRCLEQTWRMVWSVGRSATLEARNSVGRDIGRIIQADSREGVARLKQEVFEFANVWCQPKGIASEKGQRGDWMW